MHFIGNHSCEARFKLITNDQGGIMSYKRNQRKESKPVRCEYSIRFAQDLASAIKTVFNIVLHPKDERDLLYSINVIGNIIKKCDAIKIEQTYEALKMGFNEWKKNKSQQKIIDFKELYELFCGGFNTYVSCYSLDKCYGDGEPYMRFFDNNNKEVSFPKFPSLNLVLAKREYIRIVIYRLTEEIKQLKNYKNKREYFLKKKNQKKQQSQKAKQNIIAEKELYLLRNIEEDFKIWLNSKDSELYLQNFIQKNDKEIAEVLNISNEIILQDLHIRQYLQLLFSTKISNIKELIDFLKTYNLTEFITYLANNINIIKDIVGSDCVTLLVFLCENTKETKINVEKLLNRSQEITGDILATIYAAVQKTSIELLKKISPKHIAESYKRENEFIEAAYWYKKELEKTDKDVNLKYLIALCYRLAAEKISFTLPKAFENDSAFLKEAYYIVGDHDDSFRPRITFPGYYDIDYSKVVDISKSDIKGSDQDKVDKDDIIETERIRKIQKQVKLLLSDGQKIIKIIEYLCEAKKYLDNTKEKHLLLWVDMVRMCIFYCVKSRHVYESLLHKKVRSRFGDELEKYVKNTITSSIIVNIFMRNVLELLQASYLQPKMIFTDDKDLDKFNRALLAANFFIYFDYSEYLGYLYSYPLHNYSGYTEMIKYGKNIFLLLSFKLMLQIKNCTWKDKINYSYIVYYVNKVFDSFYKHECNCNFQLKAIDDDIQMFRLHIRCNLNDVYLVYHIAEKKWYLLYVSLQGNSCDYAKIEATADLVNGMDIPYDMSEYVKKIKENIMFFSSKIDKDKILAYIDTKNNENNKLNINTDKIKKLRIDLYEKERLLYQDIIKKKALSINSRYDILYNLAGVNYLQYIFAGNQDQSLLNESEKNLLSIPLVNSTFSDVKLKLKIYQQIYYNRPDEYIEKLYDDVCKYAECFKKYLSNSVNEIVSIKDCIMAYYNIIFVYLSDILDSAQGTQFKGGFDIKQATSLFGSIKYFNDIILNNPKQIFAEKLDDNYKKQIKLMFDRITEQLLKLVKLSPKQKYVFKDIKPLLGAIDMQRLVNENQIIFKQLVIKSMQLKRKKEDNHKNPINCLTSNFSPNSSLNNQIKKQRLIYKDQGEFLLFLLHKGMVIPFNKKILKIKNPIITQKYLISARRVFLLINKFCQQKQNIDFFKGCRFILKRQFNSYDDDKIKQLFSKLINVREGKKLGRTCLHKAVIANNFYLVKFLLEYNPDLSIRDNNNKTAFDLAKKDGNVEIINVFKSKMGIKQSNERANVMDKRNG